jgi:hypothetical protein
MKYCTEEWMLDITFVITEKNKHTNKMKEMEGIHTAHINVP